MKLFRVGVIGLGARGYWWINDLLWELPQVEITALCDQYRDRVEAAAQVLAEKTGKTPALLTTDYRELIGSDTVDTVLIFSAWNTHIPFACHAMEAGKAVGLEVAGAYSVEDCFRLVHTYERTKTPFMLLENCCYGEIEMTVTRMVRQGLFGTVSHCDGAYRHDLRNEVATGKENRHYRLQEYLHRNCENYPTHELGPIAKLLNIGNGNRFTSLVSVASAAHGMAAYTKATGLGPADAVYAQGDIVTTVLTCAGGETVTITLDTTLPRPYSRDFTVHGTKALFEEKTYSLFLDGEHQEFDWDWRKQWGNMDGYMEQYRHPLWQKFRSEGVQGGHGGMDYLVICAFFDALEKGLPMPIDVYDAATWMAVTALSEQSVALGGQPMAFPDFTGGKWQNYTEPLDWIYAL